MPPLTQRQPPAAEQAPKLSREEFNQIVQEILQPRIDELPEGVKKQKLTEAIASPAFYEARKNISHEDLPALLIKYFESRRARETMGSRLSKTELALRKRLQELQLRIGTKNEQPDDQEQLKLILEQLGMKTPPSIEKITKQSPDITEKKNEGSAVLTYEELKKLINQAGSPQELKLLKMELLAEKARRSNSKDRDTEDAADRVFKEVQAEVKQAEARQAAEQARPETLKTIAETKPPKFTRSARKPWYKFWQ